MSEPRRVLVRYRVKEERVDENVALVQAVFAELARAAPGGLRYATFRSGDGRSFVHLASIEVEDGVNPLLAVAAFQEFSRTVRDRCEQPPVTEELTAVGTYRLFS